MKNPDDVTSANCRLTSSTVTSITIVFCVAYTAPSDRPRCAFFNVVLFASEQADTIVHNLASAFVYRALSSTGAGTVPGTQALPYPLCPSIGREHAPRGRYNYDYFGNPCRDNRADLPQQGCARA